MTLIELSRACSICDTILCLPADICVFFLSAFLDACKQKTTLKSFFFLSSPLHLILFYALNEKVKRIKNATNYQCFCMRLPSAHLPPTRAMLTYQENNLEQLEE